MPSPMVMVHATAAEKQAVKEGYAIKRNLIGSKEQNGYFITDSSSWVAAKKEMNSLKILFRGDPLLINTYHTLCQP